MRHAIITPRPVYAPDPPAAPPATPPAGDPPPAPPPPAGNPPPAPPAPPAGDPPAPKAGDPPPAPPAANALDYPAQRAAYIASLPEGERKAAETLLNRYQSIDQALAGVVERERVIRTGGHKANNLTGAEMPAEDKPDDLKAWRAANGVPAEATGYEVPKAVTEMVMEADKPFVSQFFTDAHKSGLSKAGAETALSLYFQMRDGQIEAEQARDKAAEIDSAAELKTAWGSEYTGNNNLASQYAETVAPGLLDARLDGVRLRDMPAVMKAFAQSGLQKFGDAAFVGDNAQFTQSRYSELQEKMKNTKEWEAHPEWREELIQLEDAKQRVAAARG